MRKSLLILAVSGLGLFAAATAFAADSGTADEAKALLAKAADAIKADKTGAVAKFNDANGGFMNKDLYVFCFDKTGVEIAGPKKGVNFKEVKDSAGKAFTAEMLEKAKDGEVSTVEYMFPKPGATDPSPKESFYEGFGDMICGVGYYK
jgi:signal transduction histidine kinase